jgi:putative glutamine amidotransferase
MKKILNLAILGKTDENGTAVINSEYFTPFNDFGASYTTFSYTTDAKTIETALEKCDGIVLTGGVDVHPKRYNESILNDSVTIDERRDEMEFAFVERALKKNLPILAICRGVQLLAVAMGGTLYQDLPTQKPSDIAHKQVEAKSEFSHFINIEKTSPLYALIGKERARVNSFHHQAIKTLPPTLSVMATSDDGIVEAVFGKGTQYIRGYQWHPERLYSKDELSQKIFLDFLSNCNK